MPRKKRTPLSDLIGQVSSSITSGQGGNGNIPDILTFIYNEKYLGFNSYDPPLKLSSIQEIILKVFYRGTEGNEYLELTEEEKEICRQHGLDSAENGYVLSKYDSGTRFKELVLIWGRRGGKDFILSIIALYEAMKLIEIPGGDPYAYYNLAPGAPITILTIAASNQQSMTAFNEIREKVLQSNYFSDKFLNEGLETQSLHLLTPADKKLNQSLTEKGIPLKKGSIKVEAGHSNPDTLVGKSVYCLIADEVASFQSGTGGPSTGERIYQLLTPMTNTYKIEKPLYDSQGNPILDDNGEQVTKSEYHGKVMSISSPRGQEGKLYELYDTAPNVPQRLMCRLPTWEVSHLHTYESLREAEPTMSDEQFDMEYGAKFSGTAGEACFIRENVEYAFQNNYSLRRVGEPGKKYFAHLDPATNSHNYALAVCHRENFVNKETRQADFRIVIDLLKFWHPTAEESIKIEEVDNYIINLRKHFHLGLVTYDLWNSQSSIQKMKKHGIPAKQQAFNRNFKMKIYTELENLLNEGKIIIPPTGPTEDMSKASTTLLQEMIELQRRYDARGFKVYPKKDGDGVKTDDLTDSVAGAAFNTLASHLTSLPKAKTVDHGSSSSNNMVWRNMQGGVQGIGTGQQVSQQYERRNSWPNYKR